mmetsp:Transcript_14932/g.21195  ORF Transcript_14932/g.21195 Transcript_14932/m.21195 type:complete len:176 (-) Transcript_14932:14-541(-)
MMNSKLSFISLTLLLSFANVTSFIHRSICMSNTNQNALVIPPDFKLPGVISAIGLGLATSGNEKFGYPLLGIGAFLGIQTTRIRFTFDAEAMEIKIQKKGENLSDMRDNIVVGGKNRWTYDNWVNWEVYPSESLPILLYFFEKQTRPEGQIHFFPIIMDKDLLLGEIKKRVPIKK